MEEIDRLTCSAISSQELEKVRNKVETSILYSEIKALDKAMTLAMFELFGDAKLANQEIEKYKSLNVNDLLNNAMKLFRPENSSTLYYCSNNNHK